jgi:fused signal recognition particle receptor
VAEPVAAERKSWLDKLKTGLRKTGTGIQAVFVNAQIDDALYEELESALLMADTGVKATEFLLDDLRGRVKRQMATTAPQVKLLLADAIADLLKPLEKPLVIGQFTPTVIMVAGVNGAGKTTSIGKLTKHLANEGASVLLAAADTFRAAAREQLLVWADRNTVEIVSNEGGDPSAVSFDAVNAGKARGKDVVLVDTAGRLPTQLHLMDELKKIKRVVTKADATAPHEVLLVIDGNTGQNALAQVKAFDETLGLTGPDRDQARRHGQGRRAVRHCARAADSGVFHRRRREAGRPRDLQCARVRAGAARLVASPADPGPRNADPQVKSGPSRGRFLFLLLFSPSEFQSPNGPTGPQITELVQLPAL